MQRYQNFDYGLKTAMHCCVENASSYEAIWFCGNEYNVGLETQKMFILKAKQSFLAML